MLDAMTGGRRPPMPAIKAWDGYRMEDASMFTDIGKANRLRHHDRNRDASKTGWSL
jgi:hypothetical protein